MRHNFIDKKTPKPQPDTTLTDHSVRTELPKSAGQWGRPSPAEPGKKWYGAPCKKETGTAERGRSSPSTQAPPMSGSGRARPRDKKKNQSRPATLCPPKKRLTFRLSLHFSFRPFRTLPGSMSDISNTTSILSIILSPNSLRDSLDWPKNAHDPASEFHLQQFHNEKDSGVFFPHFHW